jgi:PAS domain S-box-containing protein
VSSSATPLFNVDGSLRGYQGVDIDITARKQAEDALRESETRFDQSAQQSHTYLWEVDADGLYTFASHVVADVLGYQPDELVGKLHFDDLFPEECRAALRAEIASAIQHRQPFRDYENLCQAKDGRKVWVITSAIPLLDADGSLRGYRGSDTDITERKRAEESLRESETRLRTLNDNLPGGLVYQMDSGVDGREFRLLAVSKGVERLHGVTAEEALRKQNIFSLQLVEEDHARVAELTARAIATLTPFRAEVRCRMPTGEIKWIYVSSAPRRQPNGHVLWDGIELDITERKQAEEALWETETRLRTLHDNLPGGLVYQVDTGVDGQQRMVTFMSKGAEQLHGIPAEEIMRDSSVLYQQFVEEDLARFAELEAQAIAATTPFQAEARLRLPSGRIRWGLFASAPRRLPNGHLIWDGIELDITERKRAEEARQQSETKYRRLHEGMRDAFVSTDMQGHILETNAAFLVLTGYSEEEIRDLTYLELTPAKWHARETKIVAEQVLPRGYSDVYQKEYFRKDGSIVPVELRTILIRDAYGNPTGMWAIVRDITERKRVERALQRANDELERRVAERTAALVDSQQALKQSEAQFRQMTDIIQEVFWLIDAQTGRALYVSPAFEAIWGRPPRKEDPGLFAWAESLHPDDRERAMQTFRNGMATGRFDPLEVRVLRPDGAIRWIEVHGWMLHPTHGEPLRIAGVMRDITERRRLEAEILRASEAERQRIGRDLHDSLGQVLTGIGYLAEALREELKPAMPAPKPARPKNWAASSKMPPARRTPWPAACC